MEKGIVFYPSKHILESDISKMSHYSTVVLSKFLEKVFTLKKKKKFSQGVISSFASFLPYKLPSQTLMFISWAVPNPPSPAPNYVTLENNKCQFILYDKPLGKGKKRVLTSRVGSFSLCVLMLRWGNKCCIPIPSLPTRISFLVTLGSALSSGELHKPGLRQS